MRFYIAVVFLVVLIFGWHSPGVLSEASGNADSSLTHFQPMVAVLCGHGKYKNQYLDENRQWVSDSDTKATCTSDKLEVLEYCRKVYPKKDIRNIVESGRYYKIDRWCKVGQKKCKASHWVRPYRCLEGPFQSDALLVPEHCLFDHIHNQSICQTFDEWNHTAAGSCENRSMRLKSFAMLLPCGVDIFAGVEFVCCPKEEDQSKSIGSSENELDSNDDDDEDDGDDYDDDDNYYDSDYDSSSQSSSTSSSTTTTTTTTTTSTTTTEKPVDYYFTHFDSKREHDAFKEAQKSLEDSHREKVTKVMKEWSELEERYQEMKLKDPNGAEDFRKKMSSRFQKTVEALEEEGAAEKRQLSAMHQQRVMTIVNLRKKSAMDCYTSALDQNPPKTKKIEKCLEKLLRALEKDRVHTLHHYRHVLSSSPKQAAKEKEAMLEHLESLHYVANQSLAMLERAPSVADKIRDRMMSLWHHLHGLGPEEEVSKDADRAILDKYNEEAEAKQREREHRKRVEEERRQEMKEMREEKKRVEVNHGAKLEREFDPESMEDETVSASTSVAPSKSSFESASLVKNTLDKVPHEDVKNADKLFKNEHQNIVHNSLDYPQQRLHDELLAPRLAAMQKDTFHQSEASYSVRKEDLGRLKWNGSLYITLAFAGIALLTAMIVGIVLLRRHSQRSSPHSQGFVEVDQAATPEERHVANMQINGYENPTYKYFEAQSN